MELQKFESKIIYNKSQVLLEKILNSDNKSNFSKIELQIYWEIKPLLFVFKNVNLLENMSKTIEDKHIFKNNFKNFSHSILKVIENAILINSLALDKNILYKQLLSSLFMISLNNKLIVEIQEGSYLYIQKHKIINEIVENLKKFFIFFDTNNLYDLNSIENQKELLCLVDYLLFLFCKKKFLKKKIRKISLKDGVKSDSSSEDENKKIKLDIEKSMNYYALTTENIEYNSYNITLRIFFFKLTMITYDQRMYYKSFHYLSVSEAYRPNISSNQTFVLNEDTNTLKSLNEMEYYINYEMYDIIYNKIKQKYDLMHINEDDIESHIYKQYLYTLKNSVYSTYQQRLNSDLYYALIFIYLKKYKLIFTEKFYLSYFFDFRGRLYSDSIISPIGFKWFRYLYNYGNYSNIELENIKFFEETDYKQHCRYIKENTKFFNLKNLENLKNHEYYIISVCFFEIGKIFKTKNLKDLKNKFTYKNFIEIGCNEYNSYFENGSKNLEFKKELDIIYIIHILNNWMSGNYKKFIIWKDATASAIQIQTVIFNSDNEENYFHTNLKNDDCWRDTYYYIIEMFKKDLIDEIIIKKIIEIKKYDIDIKNLDYNENYFNRDTLKQVIMTLNYSATVGRCYNEFLLKINKIGERKNKFLYFEYYIFYYYLKDLLNEGNFFKKEEQQKINEKLIEMVKENNYILQTPDFSLVNYKYNSWSNFRTDWKIENERSRTQFRKFDEKTDIRKTKRAFKPNFIHSLDATLVRMILKLCPAPIITIHDSFGIDILNIMLLIKIANIAFNDIKKNKNDNFIIYSNFILL